MNNNDFTEEEKIKLINHLIEEKVYVKDQNVFICNRCDDVKVLKRRKDWVYYFTGCCECGLFCCNWCKEMFFTHRNKVESTSRSKISCHACDGNNYNCRWCTSIVCDSCLNPVNIKPVKKP